MQRAPVRKNTLSLDVHIGRYSDGMLARHDRGGDRVGLLVTGPCCKQGVPCHLKCTHFFFFQGDGLLFGENNVDATVVPICGPTTCGGHLFFGCHFWTMVKSSAPAHETGNLFLSCDRRVSGRHPRSQRVVAFGHHSVCLIHESPAFEAVDWQPYPRVSNCSQLTRSCSWAAGVCCVRSYPPVNSQADWIFCRS